MKIKRTLPLLVSALALAAALVGCNFKSPTAPEERGPERPRIEEAKKRLSGGRR
jgi:hypothetical protein